MLSNVIQGFIFLLDVTPMTVAPFAPDEKENSGPPESPLENRSKVIFGSRNYR